MHCEPLGLRNFGTVHHICFNWRQEVLLILCLLFTFEDTEIRADHNHAPLSCRDIPDFPGSNRGWLQSFPSISLLPLLLLKNLRGGGGLACENAGVDEFQYQEPSDRNRKRQFEPNDLEPSLVKNGRHVKCKVNRKEQHLDAETPEFLTIKASGDKLYAFSDYNGAIEAYTLALEINPRHLACRANRAAALMMKLRYSEAASDSIHSAAADPAHLPANLCAGKALAALGRVDEARSYLLRVKDVVEARRTLPCEALAVDLLDGAVQGLTNLKTYDALLRRGFRGLESHRASFYLPLVGRWRAWRRDSGLDDDVLPAIAGVYLKGETEAERRRARTMLLASDAVQCAQRAAHLAPAAAEPVILHAWALMVHGNASQAAAWCESHYRHPAVRLGPLRLDNVGEWGLPAGSELWVIRGRALHLMGDDGSAERLFRAALGCKLAALDHLPLVSLSPPPPSSGQRPRPTAPPSSGLPSHPNKPSSASVPLADGTGRGDGSTGREARKQGESRRRLSERDLERLQRECRFSLQLIGRLGAALESARRLAASGLWSKALEECVAAAALDPHNHVHCARALALGAEIRLASVAPHPAGPLTLSVAAAARAAIADAFKALLRRAQAGGRGGERAYVALGIASVLMGKLEAGIGNLTLAAGFVAEGERAAVMEQLRLAVEAKRRGDEERWAGFAGFRRGETRDEGGAAAGAPGGEPGQKPGRGPATDVGGEDGTSDQRRAGLGDGPTGWAGWAERGRGHRFEDWTKARWETEYNDIYRRFTRPAPPSPTSPAGRPHASDAPPPPPRPQAAARAGGGGGSSSSGRPGLYGVLGVSRGAGAAEMKKAYMRLALELHPDKYRGSKPREAEERFKLVSTAYQTLSDPARRADYDVTLPDMPDDTLDTHSTFSFRARP